MRCERVTLRAAPGWAWLGELTGRDEAAVHDLSTATAIALLDGLVGREGRDGVQPGQAIELTAADRDRLLAVVYRRTYGDRIVSTLTCEGCGGPFDVSFSLVGLVDSLTARTAPAERLADGSVRLADGPLVRVPTGRDEVGIAALPAADALRALCVRCLVAAERPLSVEELSAALESIAPIIDVELDAPCPECGREQAARFDIQSFLLASLLGERAGLLGDVHRLARAYGWSRESILLLTRHERRAYAAFIEAEAFPRRRALA